MSEREQDSGLGTRLGGMKRRGKVEEHYSVLEFLFSLSSSNI